MDIKRFEFTSKSCETTVLITATCERKAWEKFCFQRFGALKPDRNDWNVLEVDNGAITDDEV